MNTFRRNISLPALWLGLTLSAGVSWAEKGAGFPPDGLALSVDGSEGLSSGPYRLSIGPNGAVFVLDRGSAVLYRFSPETGEVIWSIDGSESGERFIDPAYLSRPDGFFIYLTDRGRRLVWRIDYRGEIRGSLDLAFARDPVLLELISGSQLVVYDRDRALIHILDDSGRGLWSFAPGAGRKTAEPVDLCVSSDGSKLYLLWPEGDSMSAVDLFGRSCSTIQAVGLMFTPQAVVCTGDQDGEALCLAAGRKGPVVFLDPMAGAMWKSTREFEFIWDSACTPAEPGVIYILVGPEPALVKIKLERGD
ncbi:MAG: hypothetical protein U9N45_03765 [Gemmatimonadota bacterium]|nr:hypothetical protein [Gemmatimonadota bacterium]